MALSDLNLPSWSSNPRGVQKAGVDRHRVADQTLQDLTLTMQQIEFIWGQCCQTYRRSPYSKNVTTAEWDVIRHCPTDMRFRISYDLKIDSYEIQCRTRSYSNQTVISSHYLGSMDSQMAQEVVFGIQRTLIEQMFEKTMQDLPHNLPGMSVPSYVPLDFEDARRLMGDDLNLKGYKVTEPAPTTWEKRQAAFSAARGVKNRG